MQEDRSKILERIRKLLAVAEDARGNENEAASAARMAEALMRKYQIDNIDSIRSELETGAADSFDTADVVAQMNRSFTRSKRVPLWAQWIAVAVAKLHDCQARQAINSQGAACIRLSGYRVDIQVAQWTYDYLVATVIRLCKDFRAGPYYTGDATEINSYRNGLSTGITKQLAVMLAEKTREMAQTSSGRSLVVVKTDAVSKHFGSAKYKDSRSYARDGAAFARGRQDGANVDVSRRGITATPGSKSLLLK